MPSDTRQACSTVRDIVNFLIDRQLLSPGHVLDHQFSVEISEG